MKINLCKNEIFFIDGDARDVSIKCDNGSLWITQPADSRDHILSIGKAFKVTQKGKVVVVAVKDSTVIFSKLHQHPKKMVREQFVSSPVLNQCW